MIIAQVRKNGAGKMVTIPSDSGVEIGEYVVIYPINVRVVDEKAMVEIKGIESAVAILMKTQTTESQKEKKKVEDEEEEDFSILACRLCRFSDMRNGRCNKIPDLRITSGGLCQLNPSLENRPENMKTKEEIEADKKAEKSES